MEEGKSRLSNRSLTDAFAAPVHSEGYEAWSSEDKDSLRTWVRCGLDVGMGADVGVGMGVGVGVSGCGCGYVSERARECQPHEHLGHWRGRRQRVRCLREEGRWISFLPLFLCSLFTFPFTKFLTFTPHSPVAV